MFQRYTGNARRVIFSARYEASQFGSPYIETEHLLLGLLRKCKDVGARFSIKNLDYGSVYKEVESTTLPAPKTSVSVDLALSNENKRVLAYAAEEAERLASRNIGPEHILLGLLREPGCFTAQVLKQRGADPAVIRAKVAGLIPPGPEVRDRGLGIQIPRQAAVTLHDCTWNADYIRDVVEKCREIAWHWEKKEWTRRDVVVNRTNGALSFDLALVEDKDNFELLKSGWKKDHCVICRWELYESDEAEHGTGYSNGREWLCCECYERFVGRDDFFQSSYPEIT
jgi:hypothetical protein